MRGGWRPGAGRKAKGYVAMTILVPAETRDNIRDLAEGMGASNGEAVAHVVQDYVERLSR